MRIPPVYFVALFCFIPVAATADSDSCKKYYDLEDYQAALTECRAAAETGSADAAVLLGVMYESGKTGSANYEQAASWYRKAAEQGSPVGQTNLGDILSGLGVAENSGIAEDSTQAVEWYRKAAAQGFPRAQLSLGLMYQTGSGVATDYAKAVEWYTKAADQGYALAQRVLGLTYKNDTGKTGVPQDFFKAKDWLSKAANLGDASAQHALGELYERGQGVPHDGIIALKWYILAASNGDSSYVDARDKLTRSLPAESVVKAQELAKQFASGG